MKILCLNASPKKNNSDSMYLTNAFIKGLNENSEHEIEIINLSDLNILPCKGCLSCWGKTAGNCVIKNDDIYMMKEKIERADIFIESFPLYFFGLPGNLKVFTDRMMMLMSTYKGQLAPENGNSYHGFRYDLKTKFVLISSCAYTDTLKAYEPLISQFDCICGKDNYTPIFSSQIKTLIDLKNDAKIERFLNKFIEAGREFNKNLKLSDETISSLQKPPFSNSAYKVFLEKFWENESKR